MRKVARELVFKLVFEYTFYDKPNEDTLEYLLLDSSLDDSDKVFIRTNYYGVIENIDSIKEIIAKHLTKYTIDRVYKPDLVVMMIATYELMQKQEPIAVIIDAAVNLGKKYGTMKSGRFINGVLAKVATEF